MCVPNLGYICFVNLTVAHLLTFTDLMLNFRSTYNSQVEN